MKKALSLILAAVFMLACLTAVSCSSDGGLKVERSFLAGYEAGEGVSNRVLMNLWSDGNMDIYVGTVDANVHSTAHYTGTYSFGENEEFDETVTFTYTYGEGLTETVSEAVIIDGIFEAPFYLNGAVTAGDVSFYESAPASTDGDVYVGYMTKTGGMGSMVYAYALCLKEGGKFDVSIMQMASVMHVWGKTDGTYTVNGENVSFVYDVVDDVGEVVTADYTAEGTGFNGTQLNVGFNIAQASVRASDAAFIKVN